MKNRKRSLYILVFLVLQLGVYGQPPQGYYDSTGNLSGQALFVSLNQIIANHQQQTYSSLWTHFQTTDKKSDGKVWCMYSDVPGGTPPYQYTFVTDQCGNYSKEGDCYNREHSWPASWFNDTYPAYSDLFHLYPTDGYVNNRRGNFPYGVVSSATWTSMNGGKLGPNVFPGYSGTVFEPIDEYKGDFARSYFYMATRYLNQDAGWAVTDMTQKSQLKAWAVNLLYAWHLADTVSQKEIDRNNAVYAIQGNRNPYIDNPFWVRAIWGPDASVPKVLKPESFLVYPNPAGESCRIVLKDGVKSSYQVFILSLDGRQVFVKAEAFEDGFQLNLNGLAAGLYLVGIRCEESGHAIYQKLSIISEQ